MPGRVRLAGVRRRRPGPGGAAGRRGRGPAPAGRPIGMAASAAGRGRADGPGPPEAGRSPVRSGVLRRLRAHPAAGGSHRPGPAWYRHSDAVSHHGTQRGSCSLEASAEADLAPAPRPARH